MIHDVVIAGIQDDDIKTRIMGIKGLCDKSTNDIVSLVKAEEMTRDSLPQMHHAATVSDHKKPKKPLTCPQGERQEKILCPQYQMPFYPYKKGRFRWNKSPHTICTDCFRQTTSSKMSSSKNLEVINKFSITLTDLCNLIKQHVWSARQQDHTSSQTVSGRRWILWSIQRILSQYL